MRIFVDFSQASAYSSAHHCDCSQSRIGVTSCANAPRAYIIAPRPLANPATRTPRRSTMLAIAILRANSPATLRSRPVHVHGYRQPKGAVGGQPVSTRGKFAPDGKATKRK